jgi:glycosyltransferase involved in cell wall biosynthesis
MINVLFIIWSLDKGGAERFLTTLVKHIDRNKIKPIVCCLNYKGRWASELEDLGIEVIELNKKGKFDVKTFIKLVKILKNYKIHIVNTHLWAADTMGRLAAIIANTPVIVSTVHSIDIWKKYWHRCVDKLLSYKTDKIIAVSKTVRDQYHKKFGIPISKLIYIPITIELKQFSNIGATDYLYNELKVDRDNFIVACIGRLSKEKGQIYLLESIRLLSKRYTNIRVLFVGNGEDEGRLKEISRMNNMNDVIRFLGFRKDVPQILNISHSLVLPSLYEGMPLCVLEAMASAKPVIATKVGGVSELIVDGDNGFVVPPKDIKALASAIERLMTLSDRGEKLGAKGKEIFLNKFLMSNSINETSNLFLSLTKQHNKTNL